MIGAKVIHLKRFLHVSFSYREIVKRVEFLITSIIINMG